MIQAGPAPHAASPHARSSLEADGWTFVASQILKLMFFFDRHGKHGWAAEIRRQCLALLVPAERGLRRLIVLMAGRILSLPVRAAPGASRPAPPSLSAPRPLCVPARPSGKPARPPTKRPQTAACSAGSSR